MTRSGFEWPTLALIAACYLVWIAGITIISMLWLPLGIFVAALSAALHSSLQHEIIHHHPFQSDNVNEALVTPALTLLIPYRRFRDTHLAHHIDENLTDPYDDPESNFMDPEIWSTLPGWQRRVLRVNNTLLGRVLIGPVVAQITFMQSDWKAIRAENRSIRNAWLMHIPAVAIVILIVALSPMPLWAYLIAAYAGLSVLKIRTFLEHRSYPDSQGRTVVVEDSGPLAFLFLNNNLHVVHHAHPGIPWYALPKVYKQHREAFLARNSGYRYRSYAEVFSRYVLTPKDPVPHPTMPAPLDLSSPTGALTEIQKETRHASASDHRLRGLHAR